jgi:hypothetical protein
MKAARIAPGQFCQCGRPIVILGKYGSLKVCQGCGTDNPFCSCGPIGLGGLERLLRDVRSDA